MARDENKTAESNRDLTISIDKLTARLDSMDRAFAAGARATASETRLGLTAVGAGGVGYGVYKASRRVGFGNAAGAIGASMFGFCPKGMTGGAGRAMMALRFIGPLGAAIAGIALALKAIGAGNSSGNRNSMGGMQAKQVSLLADLYQQSLRQSQSLAAIQAVSASRADPFNRSPATMRALAASRGTGVSNRQAFNAASLEASRQRAAEATGAVNSYWSSILDPIKTAANNAKAKGYEISNSLLRGRGVSGGAFRGGVGAAMGPLGLLYAYRSQSIRGDRGKPGIDPFTSGPLGGFRERQLMQLGTYGPMQVGRPAMSVRGGEGAYAFGVHQQYAAEDRNAVRQWQDRVLATLEAMLAQGKPVQDELYQRLVQFGRAPRLDGVD